MMKIRLFLQKVGACLALAACFLIVLNFVTSLPSVWTANRFEEHFGVCPEGSRAVEGLQAHVTKQLFQDMQPSIIAKLRVWDVRRQKPAALQEEFRYSMVVYNAMVDAGRADGVYKEAVRLVQKYGFQVPQDPPIGFRI